MPASPMATPTTVLIATPKGTPSVPRVATPRKHAPTSPSHSPRCHEHHQSSSFHSLLGGAARIYNKVHMRSVDLEAENHRLQMELSKVKQNMSLLGITPRPDELPTPFNSCSIRANEPIQKSIAFGEDYGPISQRTVGEDSIDQTAVADGFDVRSPFTRLPTASVGSSSEVDTQIIEYNVLAGGVTEASESEACKETAVATKSKQNKEETVERRLSSDTMMSMMSEDDIGNQSKTTSAKRIFTSILSLTSDDKDSRRSPRLQRSGTSTWKRVVGRSRKDPMEMMEAVMSCIIVANAIAIGLSCDTQDWHQGWLVVDSVFACIFTLELFVKAFCFGLAKYLWSEKFLWAWFEIVLVLLSLVEILSTILMYNQSALRGSTPFRIIRLVRLVKILRVCRVPVAADLVVMVRGIIGGSRTLFFALILVSFPLLIFALVMRETLGQEPARGDGAGSFNTLPKAFFTTFRCLVVEDCADPSGKPIFVLVAETYGWFYSACYSMALVLMKFGLCNVIVAIFVEQTVAAAKYNVAYQKRARLSDEIMFKEKALEMAELVYCLHYGLQFGVDYVSLDEINALELSKQEFSKLCYNTEFQELLTELDVAEEDHHNLFDTLDVDGGGTLDLGEIVSGVAKLRGDARKSDIVAVILMARHLNALLLEFKQETKNEFERQSRQLSSIQSVLKPMLNANKRATRQGKAVS